MKTKISLLVLSVLLVAGGVAAQETGPPQGGGEPPKPNTGTDPRDFSSKFSPYYMYTDLENGLRQNAFVISGMWAFTSKIGLIYEIPMAFEREYGDTQVFNPETGDCGPGTVPGGGIPLLNDLPILPERDCQETGMGDSTFQLLVRGGKSWGGDWVLGARFDVPTATKDVLGSETFAASPIVAWVKDLKVPGSFIAFMNLYQFDVWKDTNRGKVSQYVGRWFLMMPLSKKLKMYLLAEFQPIYNFETSEFSTWFAPEIGKAVGKNILYVKPGFGFGPNKETGDRKFTLEVGVRIFIGS